MSSLDAARPEPLSASVGERTEPAPSPLSEPGGAQDALPFTPLAPASAHYADVNKLTLSEQIHFVRALSRNSLEAWGDAQYHLPVSNFTVLGNRIAVINEPEAIRRCFLTNFENYRLNTITKAMLQTILGDGVLTANGEIWSNGRKSLTPVFSPRNVMGFADTMKRRVVATRDGLAKEESRSLEMFGFLARLTNDIVLDTLFADEQPIDRDLLVSRMMEAIWLHRAPHPFDMLSLPQWLPRWRSRRFRQVVGALRGQVAELVRDRRSRPASDSSKAAPVFLDLLLEAGLNDVEVIDNLVTFLIVGHLTTNRSLAWTFFLLSQDARSRQRLEAEIDGAALDWDDPYSWMERLPWMRAVIKESLRLYPVTPLLPRTAIGPDSLAGQSIAAGTHVLLSTWILHRHAAYWDQPGSFRPERFFGEAEKKVARFTYLPFGAGPRVCLGSSFATMEMVIVLAILLRKYRFEWAGGPQPYPVTNPALTPHVSVDMIVRTR